MMDANLKYLLRRKDLKKREMKFLCASTKYAHAFGLCFLYKKSTHTEKKEEEGDCCSFS